MKNQRKYGVILQYTQMALSTLITLIYTPIMLRILGQGEFGIYNLASSIISYLSLLSLGFGASYIRFYSGFKAKEDNDGIKKLNGLYLIVFVTIASVAFCSGIFLSLNVGRFFTAAAGYTKHDLFIAKILMMISSFNLTVTLTTSVFTSYITSQEKFVFQKIMNMGKTLLGPMLTLPLLLMGFGSIGMVVISTVVTLCVESTNVLFCLKKLKMKFIFKNLKFGMIKQIVAFSIFIVLNQIIDLINWNVNKIILAKIISKEAVAVYAITSTINAMYLHFSTAISSVYVPHINRIIQSGRKTIDSELTDLFIRVGRIQYLVTSLILFGFVFFGQYFIFRWAGKGYELAYPMTVLVIAPCTISLIQNVGVEIQRGKNKHQFRSIIYFVMALINIAVSIFLCNRIGMIGAAVGTSLSLIIANGLIMNVYYQTKLGINVIRFWKEILRMSLGLAIPIVIGIGMMHFITIGSIFQFALLAMVFAIIYCISMWFFAMNQYEKSLILKVLEKVKKLRKKEVRFDLDKEKSAGRNNSIDYFRLLCAILVVCIHAHPFSDVNSQLDFFFNQFLSRVAVPFFFCIAGYFFIQIIEQKEKVRKRIFHIIYIYIFWSLIYFIVSFSSALSNHADIPDFMIHRIIAFFITGSYYHLWYFPALIFSMIAAVCFKKINTLFYGVLLSIILYIIGVIGCAYYAIGIRIPILNQLYLFDHFTDIRRLVLMGFPFFMMGYFLNTDRVKGFVAKTNNKKIIIMVITSLVLFSAEILFVLKSSIADNIFITLFLYPLIFSIIVLLLKNPYPNSSGKAKVSRYLSSFIYYAHPLFILGVGSIYRLFVRNNISDTLSFVITLGLLFLSGLFLFKINVKQINKFIE